MNKKTFKTNLLLTVMFFIMIQLACVLPAVQQLGQPQESWAITSTVVQSTVEVVSTPSPTQTQLPEVFNCKDLESGKSAIINAKPIGVHLRVSPDSDSISVIPDGEKIEIFGSYDNGWSLVRWGDLCGYVSSNYIVGQ